MSVLSNSRLALGGALRCIGVITNVGVRKVTITYLSRDRDVDNTIVVADQEYVLRFEVSMDEF